MSKILISYFSASGVTKGVAQKLSEAINGDLFEIEPVEKYTKEDLNWMDKNSRSSIEMADKSSRPKITKKIDNIESYDSIVIGFPVWWYTAPTIINTFIEENNLIGKSIYVFVTSGSSSYEDSLRDLKEKYSSLNFVSGKRFTGNESLEDYKQWLNN